MPKEASDVAKSWSAMAKCRIAMVTNQSQNALRSRPLTAQVDESEQLIDFIVSAKSDIATDMMDDQTLLITFSDIGSQNYLAITANAILLQDPAVAKSLWNNFAQAWFPGGPDDPDVRILRCNPVRIEFWEGEGSKLVQMWEIGKALMTGTRPDLGDKVTLKISTS